MVAREHDDNMILLVCPRRHHRSHPNRHRHCSIRYSQMDPVCFLFETYFIRFHLIVGFCLLSWRNGHTRSPSAFHV